MIQLLTVKQVADILRVSEMTVYRIIASRKLASYKVGGSYRIRPEDVRSYLDSCAVKP